MLSFYPNPMRDQLTLSYTTAGPTDVNVTVVTAAGRVVFEEAMQSSASEEPSERKDD